MTQMFEVDHEKPTPADYFHLHEGNRVTEGETYTVEVWERWVGWVAVRNTSRDNAVMQVRGLNVNGQPARVVLTTKKAQRHVLDAGLPLDVAGYTE